jgi:CheY-like chemotaxis protein
MNQQRVLVLDDHEAILEVVTEALRYEQFAVMAIRTGAEFFNAVEEFKPSLILLDYQLAGINGGDLCRQLKEIKAYRSIPVIIFSAYFNPGDQNKPKDCDGYLYKPFDLVSLFEMVHLNLGKKLIKEPKEILP